MLDKSKNEEVKASKNNKKRNIVLIVVGLLLLAIILFLLWFFNRKFEVTFDYNNGTKEETVLVKYNKVINNADVKTKEDLGDSFINWYLVLGEKDGKDILDEKPFDFNTKINEKINLKAVYEGKVETITVTFDSKGGSKVSPVTINKGGELTLPKNPTYKGYTFKGWEDKDNRPVNNKAKFSEDTTLYAKWEKVEAKTTSKSTTTKATTKPATTTTTTKGPESISLSLTNRVIAYFGTKRSSDAVAKVKNASGDVTYSISSNKCMKIDSKTGHITIKGNNLQYCSENGGTATVTATLPSGKSASDTITLEKILVLRVGNKEYNRATKDKSFPNTTNSFLVIANQIVKFTATGVKPGSEVTVLRYAGKANPDVSRTTIKATTAAGQEVEVYCTPYVA